MNDRHFARQSGIFLLPYYHARTAEASEGFNGQTTAPIDDYFQKHFGRQGILTPNGRTAISVILQSLDLNPDDEIYVTTTFEKPNVSSCVTCTIFNFCKPSRVLTDKARAIFVIHEFGMPHPRIDELVMLAKQKGIPLVEDCAHTIDSRYNGRMVGQSGDYVICSFPKIFPVQYGGLLIGENLSYQPTDVQRAIIEQVKRTLPRYLSSLTEYSNRKRKNFRLLESRFKRIGLKPWFEINEEISPSFHFPLVVDKFEKVIQKATESGIECGLWHGTNIVVLPAHQFLKEEHLERIFEVVKFVYEEGGSN